MEMEIDRLCVVFIPTRILSSCLLYFCDVIAQAWIFQSDSVEQKIPYKILMELICVMK